MTSRFPEDENQYMWMWSGERDEHHNKVYEKVMFAQHPRTAREAAQIGLEAILDILMEPDVKEIVLDGGMIIHQPLLYGKRRKVPYDIRDSLLVDVDDPDNKTEENNDRSESDSV